MHHNKQIAIILVEPQMGENIGSTARVMQNFNISDLRIVNPRDGWPNKKAESMSVGAIGVINNARIYSSISEASVDLHYLYATTGRNRNINKPSIYSEEIKDTIPAFGNIGIMFGRESTGLTNDELSKANTVININVNSEFMSLNLSHAVAIITYEIFKLEGLSTKKRKNVDTTELATNNELEHFYSHMFSALDNKNFFRTQKQKLILIHKIRNMISRIDHLTHTEVQILRGIISSLSKS